MRGKLPACINCGIALRITPADAGKTLPLRKLYPISQDHPRGCGENIIEPNRVFIAAGSPPRMRGKRSHTNMHCLLSRITPADAGKTAICDLSHTNREDHPRGCGENHITDNLSTISSGSPPRMRGKHTYRTLSFSGSRITPADAGKT